MNHTGAISFRQILSKLNQNKLNSLAIHLLKDFEKVQVGKDEEKAQSERDSHSKNRGENLKTPHYTMAFFLLKYRIFEKYFQTEKYNQSA